MKPVLKISSFILLITVLVLLSCQKEMPCEGCAEKNKPPIAVAGPESSLFPVCLFRKIRLQILVFGAGRNKHLNDPDLNNFTLYRSDYRFAF